MMSDCSTVVKQAAKDPNTSKGSKPADHTGSTKTPKNWFEMMRDSSTSTLVKQSTKDTKFKGFKNS